MQLLLQRGGVRVGLFKLQPFSLRNGNQLREAMRDFTKGCSAQDSNAKNRQHPNWHDPSRGLFGIVLMRLVVTEGEIPCAHVQSGASAAGINVVCGCVTLPGFPVIREYPGSENA